MSFIVKSYGDGSLGDVSEITSSVNSYAAVTAITANSITIDAATKITGTADFTVGAKILIHVSATTGSTSALKIYLGKWCVATVTAVSGNVLTLDEDPTKIIPADSFAKYYVQAVAIAQYKNLTLTTGTTLTPPVYNVSSYHGGIVAIMCSETLTFAGGHISLTDRGIPITSKALRPDLKFDAADLDTEDYSVMENYCAQTFPLNAGDGAAFIVAKKLVCNENSRIGNVATFGVQFYRGSTKSVTYNEDPPENVTNVGGSSIFIAARTIENFSPKMIAKYRSSASTKGQGLCRCYITSATKLRNDEGLYSYDVISDPLRLSREMNIKNFGNGSFGDGTDLTTQLNNYATITAINGKNVTYKDRTTAGLVQIQQGALVMIHFNHKSSSNVVDSGRFILANVLADNGTTLTLDAAPPDISLDNYAAQIVSIPQFNNFTLTKTNSATPAFDGAQGGILALAVKDTCSFTNGKLQVEEKGGGEAYAREGLAVIGNAQDCDKLPIGQGHGSIFLLAQNLTLKNTGTAGRCTFGNDGSSISAISYCGGTSSLCGSGADGGQGKFTGGYGSNSAGTTSVKFQGAHVMIVADTITGLKTSMIRTGGSNSTCGNGGGYVQASSGSTTPYGGYNGGGGANTASGTTLGGSSGWCFIYCNHAVDQDTGYIVYEG